MKMMEPFQLVDFGFGGKIRDRTFLIFFGEPLLRARLSVKFLHSCGAVHVVALTEGGLLQAWATMNMVSLAGVSHVKFTGASCNKCSAKFLDEAPELVKITLVSCGEEYHTASIAENGEVKVI